MDLELQVRVVCSVAACLVVGDLRKIFKFYSTNLKHHVDEKLVVGQVHRSVHVHRRPQGGFVDAPFEAQFLQLTLFSESLDKPKSNLGLVAERLDLDRTLLLVDGVAREVHLAPDVEVDPLGKPHRGVVEHLHRHGVVVEVASVPKRSFLTIKY